MALKTPESTLTLTALKGLGVSAPSGFLAGASRCGLKSSNKDLGLIVSRTAASAAGVFTTNLVKASSVTYSQTVIAQGTARAIFCSSGNANACTGEQGEIDTFLCAKYTAEELKMEPGEVLVAHTGIIGKPLAVEKIEAGLPDAVVALAKTPDSDLDVAQAIMTTDTVPKLAAYGCESPHWQGTLIIGGVCKGSGMIAPNMATTLCFLTTDAQIAPALLQRALTKTMDRTFNRLSVDGDTSTNDMALVLANGASEAVIKDGPAHDHFCEALEKISLDLAKSIARDGEGATKLVGITVKGCATEQDAAKIAKTVAESPLVKTALFGNDPNWGRIVAAAGRAGVPFDVKRLAASIGDIVVFDKGQGVDFDRDAAHETLKQKEIAITLELNAGREEATIWTCDYSYDYIRINAEYHT